MARANHSEGPEGGQEAEFARWMRAGLDGDGAAYGRLLEALLPRLRAFVRGGLARAGLGNADVEDVVQEILLAIHVKRATWMRDAAFLPWLNAIARHKLIDAMRRRGRRGETPIDDVAHVLPDKAPEPETAPAELARLVARLDGRQGQVVAAVSLEEASIKDVAQRFAMTEGAVRVTLHRGLKKLASLYREPNG